MAQPIQKTNPALSRSDQEKPLKGSQEAQPTDRKEDEGIVSEMVGKIDKFTSLSEYKTRELVEDTQKLGRKLAKNLKTTQIRKFLDAVNRLKAELDKQLQIRLDENNQILNNDRDLPDAIRSELDLLRPKLAYAAARQRGKNRDPGPVEPLRKVLDAALQQQKVSKLKDFTRLVQLIESIIAYHKAEGGKDQ